MAKVILCLNFKGGIGKTTLAAHVARALCQFQRKSILLIDLDPQYNLTQLLYRVEEYEDKFVKSGRTAARLFSYATGKIPEAPEAQFRAPPPDGVIQNFYSSGRARLDFIPGSFDLTKICISRNHAEIERAQNMFSEFVRFCRHYDIIIIDVNPGVSVLTTAALDAADHLLCPVREDRYSYVGLQLIEEFVTSYFPEKLRLPAFFTVVMNAVRDPEQPTKTPVESQILKSTNYAFSAGLMPVRIPDSPLLQKPHFSQPGLFFDRSVPFVQRSRKANLAKTFADLSDALVARL